MKRLLLMLVIITTVLSCSKDDDNNISVLSELIGEWELQSKSINNNTPAVIEDDKLLFREDSDIKDLNGNYSYIATNETNGNFVIGIYNTIVLTTNSGNSRTYDFDLNAITLVLRYEDDDSNAITEVWTKTSHFVE